MRTIYLFVIIGFLVFGLTGCGMIFKTRFPEIIVEPVPSNHEAKVFVTHPKKKMEITIPTKIRSKDIHDSSTIRIIDSCYSYDEVHFTKEFSLWNVDGQFNDSSLFMWILPRKMFRFAKITRVPLSKKKNCQSMNREGNTVTIEGKTEHRKSISKLDEQPIEKTSRIDKINNDSVSDSDYQSHEPAKDSSYLSLLLKRLNAIQLKSLSGSATVKSYIKIDGRNDKIASGNASYGGYEIAFQRPNLKPGFSFSLTPRYLRQSIAIADFREGIPETSVPGSQNIPVVVTDYEKGIQVDPDDPNTYNIHTSSWGFIAEGQASLVQKSRYTDVFFFGELVLGIGVLEEITMEVELGTSTKKSITKAFGQSYYTGFATGLVWNKMHSIFQFNISLVSYPSLKLPETAEFRDYVKYNESKQIFERGRVFLDEIKLNIIKSQLSYTYFF